MSYISIVKDLQRRGDTKWGLVVYRCTYKDQKKWDRFMSILTKEAKADLDCDFPEEATIPPIDWSVQEDPALEGASFDEIRKRHRDWVRLSGRKLYESPRYEHCIHVDAEALESTLAAANERDEIDEPFGKEKAYVNVVDLMYGYNDANEPNYDKMKRWLRDMGLHKSNEVGYFKVSTTLAGPRVYTMLKSIAYDAVYVKPPAISVP